MKIFKSEKDKRKERNYLAYEKIKIALTECPNLAFNQYVLSLAKSFMEKGILKIIKTTSSDLKLILNDINYNINIWIEKKNKSFEVSILISPNLKINSYNIFKKVIFENGNIIMIDKKEYDNNSHDSSSPNLWDSTSLSIFQNTCQINELGENNLVYKVTCNREYGNEKNERFEAVKIMKNGETLIDEWDLLKIKNTFYKTNAVFITFEDFLKNEYLDLKKEEICEQDATIFLNNWSRENYAARERLSEEKENLPINLKYLI